MRFEIEFQNFEARWKIWGVDWSWTLSFIFRKLLNQSKGARKCSGASCSGFWLCKGLRIFVKVWEPPRVSFWGLRISVHFTSKAKNWDWNRTEIWNTFRSLSRRISSRKIFYEPLIQDCRKEEKLENVMTDFRKREAIFCVITETRTRCRQKTTRKARKLPHSLLAVESVPHPPPQWVLITLFASILSSNH